MSVIFKAKYSHRNVRCDDDTDDDHDGIMPNQRALHSYPRRITHEYQSHYGFFFKGMSGLL